MEAVFPRLPQEVISQIEKDKIYLNMNAKSGFKARSADGAGLPSLFPAGGSFKYIIETLIYIPEAKNKTVTDIYNALKDLDSLRGRTYYSESRKKNIALFSDAFRIVSDKNFRKLPDNMPVTKMPDNEIRYMRLTDNNFGNCYYRAYVQKYGYGIQFSLTNFKTIDFIFIPVIKNDGLSINYYIEPLQDGVVFYGFIGVHAASYIDNVVDVPSAILKRVGVINQWIIDGLK